LKIDFQVVNILWTKINVKPAEQEWLASLNGIRPHSDFVRARHETGNPERVRIPKRSGIHDARWVQGGNHRQEQPNARRGIGKDDPATQRERVELREVDGDALNIIASRYDEFRRWAAGRIRDQTAFENAQGCRAAKNSDGVTPKWKIKDPKLTPAGQSSAKEPRTPAFWSYLKCEGSTLASPGDTT
jgi:hypothetical protein